MNPQQREVGGSPGIGTTGTTLLPVIRQVEITIQRVDTQLTLSRRAYLQAAFSVGLGTEQANAFAARYASPVGLRWLAGDPSPRTDAVMRPSDIAVMAGKRVIFALNPAQRDELASLTAAH